VRFDANAHGLPPISNSPQRADPFRDGLLRAMMLMHSIDADRPYLLTQLVREIWSRHSLQEWLGQHLPRMTHPL